MIPRIVTKHENYRKIIETCPKYTSIEYELNYYYGTLIEFNEIIQEIMRDIPNEYHNSVELQFNVHGSGVDGDISNSITIAYNKT